MSWWIQRKGNDGKQHLWAIDIDPMAIILLLGFLAAFAGPTIIRNPFSTLVIFASTIITIGLFCLTISKISLYRQGVWRSWGTRLMTKGNARLYLIGYALMAVGTFVLIKLSAIKG
jgi:hypothetical protein